MPAAGLAAGGQRQGLFTPVRLRPTVPAGSHVTVWLRGGTRLDIPLADPKVDQLRAAGALDVPPAWRKSLGGGRPERDLLSDLPEDEEKPENEPSATSEQPTDSSGQA